MKSLILFLSVAGLLAACNDAGTTADVLTNVQDSAQEAVVDAEVNVVRQSFPQLFQYLRKQDSTFSEDSFLLAGEDQVEPVPPVPIDKERLKPFEPYFIYNGDSSLALDLYSYNYLVTTRNGTTKLEQGEPDTEAAVIDFKTGLRRRVFFGGPSHLLWDAKWINASELLLIGAESHQNGKVIPNIWRVNLRDTSVQMYAYEGEIRADMAGYKNEKQGMGF